MLLRKLRNRNDQNEPQEIRKWEEKKQKHQQSIINNLRQVRIDSTATKQKA